VLRTFLILLTFATGLMGGYWGSRAAGAARDRSTRLKIVSLGLFASRDAFTPEGWKYRQRALQCAALALMWLLAFIFVELFTG
jgi:hypothetical protein